MLVVLSTCWASVASVRMGSVEARIAERSVFTRNGFDNRTGYIAAAFARRIQSDSHVDAYA